MAKAARGPPVPRMEDISSAIMGRRHRRRGSSSGCADTSFVSVCSMDC